MPLVVPGLMSKGGDDKTNDWMSKLMGKKIGESSDEIVSLDNTYLLPFNQSLSFMLHLHIPHPT
jgi:hypothetical protein